MKYPGLNNEDCFFLRTGGLEKGRLKRYLWPDLIK